MRIEVSWDTQVDGEHGWYWQVIHEGEVIEDSVKVWARVDASAYSQDQRDELEQALVDAYLCNVIFLDEE